jgi:hypothetical protein
MSMAAKEVLIKSVAQTIPTSTCEDLTQIIRKFWRGEEGGRRKVHWITWD